MASENFSETPRPILNGYTIGFLSFTVVMVLLKLTDTIPAHNSFELCLPPEK